MKIIFLDFDGVLINDVALHARRLDPQRRPTADPDAIVALNHIVQATGAQIVVSSLWRVDYSLTELRDLLRRWGVIGEVIGQTPLSDLVIAKTRGQEIQDWLDASRERHDVERFVIVDDSFDIDPLRAHLVKTETDAGLTMSEAKMAIAHLLR